MNDFTNEELFLILGRLYDYRYDLTKEYRFCTCDSRKNEITDEIDKYDDLIFKLEKLVRHD